MSLLIALKIIVEFLEKNKIPYMVIGGIANSILGEPRQTYDIDIKIKISKKLDIENTINKLSKISTPLSKNPVKFAEEMRVIPIVIADIKIDIVIAGLEYEITAINNSVIKDFDGVKLKVCRTEDLIIQKFVSEREKDWNDIRNLIRVNFGTLDKKYILKNCKEISMWLSDTDSLVRIKKYLNEK